MSIRRIGTISDLKLELTNNSVITFDEFIIWHIKKPSGILPIEKKSPVSISLFDFRIPEMRYLKYENNGE